MLFAGIDLGSRTIKIVLIDGNGKDIVSSGAVDQGIKQSERADELFEKVLFYTGASRADVGKIVATGYGRNAISWADTTVTEITCQARGTRQGHPDARTIVDIGGQDSKVISLDKNGAVRDFVMNDRCASGTGRFIEIVAQRLERGIDEVGFMAARAVGASIISSMCAVFAESEIVGLLAAGEPPENIIAGVEKSIAKRVASMAGRKVEEPVIFTGGVALVPGMKEALAEAFESAITVAERPRLTAALGAALLAAGRSEIYAKNIK
ncbi:MAG: rod shape-determining protein [Candidatus Omnitrophica bacterium]|nr:rod shape-determining protein [Candidatus Omnitrophota bacterium]